MESQFESISNEVFEELELAKLRFKDFSCYHEGLAVILEEFEELKAEVFKKNQSKESMRQECIQIATMTVRFIIDLIETEEVKDGRNAFDN